MTEQDCRITFMNSNNIKLMEIGDGDLWNQFVKIYNEFFTNPLEWESPEEWKSKLSYKNTSDKLPVIHVLVAVHETEQHVQEVVGGIVFEHHRRSHVGFMTYIAVSPQWRKHGLSRALLVEAINKLCKIDFNLKAFIGDTEDPNIMTDDKSCMPTHSRYNVMQRLGGTPLNIKYIQPQLIGGLGVCRHLMLWSFELPNKIYTNFDRDDLIDFLYDEYVSLGIETPHLNSDFTEMIASIPEKILGQQKNCKAS